LGSLSHYLNQRCARYRDLPQFPDVAPDPSVRNTLQVDHICNDVRIAHEADVEEEEEDEEEDEDEEDFYSDDDEESDVEQSDEEHGGAEAEDEESEEAEGEEEDEEGECEDVASKIDDQTVVTQTVQPEKTGNLDLLLDLNFDPLPVTAGTVVEAKLLKKSFVPLLSHAAWPVGVAVDLCFPREGKSPFSSSMCTVLLKFTNRSGVTSPVITATP
uniref:Nucleoplasmin domain-containing protein n=1 Tax=Gongylonema pulchrum TaxID=637853 RepID=A0A183EZB9_9BILA